MGTHQELNNLMSEPLEGLGIFRGWFQYATFGCRDDILFREGQQVERGFNGFRRLVVTGRTVIGGRS